jgi:Holliday junction resolvasome RuvABC DNA-binding subunit
MNYKHNEHIKIMDNKFEAERTVQSLKNLGYNARVVKRHFAKGSANYDVVYSKKEKKLVKV